MNKLIPVFFAFLFVLCACSSKSTKVVKAPKEAPPSIHREMASKVEENYSVPANAEWERYLKYVPMKDLQKGCEPRRINPPEGVRAKGKIMLVHGYTACPQQFFEWAEILSKKGIVVYLFLMPGHGKKKLPDGSDNTKDFPEHNDYEGYSKLAESINKVAAADELPSSIAGLSVGGAVALHAAATASVPYEKLLLISPFFKMPNFLQRYFLAPIVGNTPFVKNKIIGWGEGCYDEIKRGRAGVCDFSISQVYTAQVYGKHVMTLGENLNSFTQVQLIGVEKDPGADNGAMKKVIQDIGFTKEDHVSACFYPKGSNHSLFSRFDSPDQDKFWLSSLLRDASNYVEKKQKFPAQKASEYEKGFFVCDVK